MAEHVYTINPFDRTRRGYMDPEIYRQNRETECTIIKPADPEKIKAYHESFEYKQKQKSKRIREAKLKKQSLKNPSLDQ